MIREIISKILDALGWLSVAILGTMVLMGIVLIAINLVYMIFEDWQIITGCIVFGAMILLALRKLVPVNRNG